MCVGLINCPDVSYQLWGAATCDLEAPVCGGHDQESGRRATRKNCVCVNNVIQEA